MYSSISLNFLFFLICPLQVFPPVPVRMNYKFFAKKKNRLGLVPQEDKPCPYYITPIKGTLFFVLSKGFFVIIMFQTSLTLIHFHYMK